MSYHPIDIPFNLRHTCWFCGEPSLDLKEIKQLEELLAIPACSDCFGFTVKEDVNTIWEYRDQIKFHLISKYAKHLSIGDNWTEEELEDADLSGSILEGFGKSAWPMYLIAKDRIAYKGWPIYIDGVALSHYDESYSFEFNGLKFADVHSCIDYYIKSLSLDSALLFELVDLVKPQRLSYALKIAKLHRSVSNVERRDILLEIEQQQQDEFDVLDDEANAFDVSDDINPVTIGSITTSTESIQWALNKGINSFSKLAQNEDAFFDDFEHLGGPEAFSHFNGLQLYFEAREDALWRAKHDPNRHLWNTLKIMGATKSE